MNDIINMEDYLSIGELARQTGIGIHTLRVWEKRYGAPHSQRLPSGHRRYPREEVPRLRAIAKALEAGYRASKVVTGTLEELQGLLGAQNLVQSKQEFEGFDSDQASKELVVENWIMAIHEYDDETLNHGFFEAWNKVGPLSFILDYATPFVERIGNGWVAGELTVGQEHFATSNLSDFLSSKWRQLNTRIDAPVAVLSTLPEEVHNLGLLMCAVVTSLSGLKIVYLGLNSPIEDILKTTTDCKASLLCISVSNCVNSDKAEDQIKQIRRLLNKETSIAVGGKGAPVAFKGITQFCSFNDYHEWLSQLDTKLKRESR